MCYTTYLYHYWIMSVIGWVALRYLPLPTSLPLQAAILAALMIPGVYLPCAGLVALTEKPFMRSDWPLRLWSWLPFRRQVSSRSTTTIIARIDEEKPRRRAA